MREKILNKEATIKNILKKCNKGQGISMNLDKFNAEISKENAEQFIIDAASLCQVNVVYMYVLKPL